jgi:hypothetical protein
MYYVYVCSYACVCLRVVTLKWIDVSVLRTASIINRSDDGGTTQLVFVLVHIQSVRSLVFASSIFQNRIKSESGN